MPSSRRRHRRREEEGPSGPMDMLLSMLSACSLEWNDDFRCGKRWESDDETEVTELSSRSSERRGKRRSSSRTRTSSSSKSSKRKMPRSRSHSVRSSGNRSRSLEKPYEEERRSRSLSRSLQTPRYESSPRIDPPTLPKVSTEIRVYHQDDDVSAISAGTLEQMEKVQILEYANKNLYRRNNTSTHTSYSNNGMIPVPVRAVVPLENYRPVFQEKENVVNFSSPSNNSQQSSHFASPSSDGTSEFESVWNKPIPKTPIGNTRSPARNHGYGAQSPSEGEHSYHLSKPHRKPRSHHASFETPRTRQMRRQIQRDGIGTIAEGEVMYSDEEEIWFLWYTRGKSD